MYTASFWSVSPPSAMAAKSPSKGKIILSSMRWTRESVSSCHSHWLRCLAWNTLCILTWNQGVILGGWEIYSSGIRCSEIRIDQKVSFLGASVCFLPQAFQFSCTVASIYPASSHRRVCTCVSRAWPHPPFLDNRSNFNTILPSDGQFLSPSSNIIPKIRFTEILKPITNT